MYSFGSQQVLMFPSKYLDGHPVDLFDIARSSHQKSLVSGLIYPWESVFGQTKPHNFQQTILECWGTFCTTWDRGPLTKGLFYSVVQYGLYI